uniref:Uncharacterized protein n=1 Tax=Timema monikensis TaxID=170555 RepID=A0A7R9HV12_9NEOP|nr:unnamed protein product [Timema monikensis]
MLILRLPASVAKLANALVVLSSTAEDGEIEKSQSNGHVTVPGEDGSESKQRNVEAGGGSLSSKQDKEKSPAKESRRELREKKQELESSPKDNNKNRQQKSRGKGKENQIEDVKNKKNEKNLAKLKKQVEKPLDFDEGEWESVSRKDKKIRKKDDMFEDSSKYLLTT